MILPSERDLRLVTIRRGGYLSDDHHHLLALWSADVAEHVLGLFSKECPGDIRPQHAIEAIRAWTRGECSMMESRAAGGHAMAAARDLVGAPRFAAFAAGQAGCVAHVAAHDLGAAAYAIKSVMESVPAEEKRAVGRRECEWQRIRLPSEIRDLVLDDQQRRNNICWGVFDV